MTREEAIELLKDFPHCERCGAKPDCSKCREALDMAIEALKDLKAAKVKNVKNFSTLSHGICPSCGKNIDDVYNPVACGYCGKLLKWEDGEHE